MHKFTLSKPQRMLFGLSILLFVVSIVWIGYFVYSNFAKNAGRGIKIEYASIAPHDANGAENQSLAFDEPVSLAQGEAIVSWNSHRLYIFGPANLTITTDGVSLTSGFAYLEPNSGTVNVTLSSQQFPVTGISGLYDSTIPGYIVTAGELQLNANETAKINNTILYDGAKFTTAAFDRTILTSDKWNRILTLLAAKSQLPVTLSDLIAPTINNISPADGAQINATTVTVTGQTEPNISITVRDKVATSDASGKFSQAIDLVTGKNSITITAVDAAGNHKTATLQYTRTSTAEAATCAQTDFNHQLLCLINAYRQAQKLPALVLNSSLNVAAQTHSAWMDQNEKLEHNEDNGSTTFSRCNTVGTTCNAESIFRVTQPTAQTVFDYLKAQSTDNANLLATHTDVGIAVSGDYGTIVYH